jgi:hypothetical protein
MLRSVCRVAEKKGVRRNSVVHCVSFIVRLSTEAVTGCAGGWERSIR